MATVTLGNIKFNWKGVWNSGTAYVIDDVVSLSGSSYVSIQAGTNQNPASASAYWQQMSAAGTNGTDIGTTLTTQGDILYRDGSGLARLGYGTAGQVLQTGGSGANPSWVNSSGGLIKTFTFTNSTRAVLSNSTDQPYYQMTFNKQENASTSKVFVSGIIPAKAGSGYFTGIYFDCLTTGVTSHNTNDGFAFKGIAQSYGFDSGAPCLIMINKVFEDTTNLGSGNHIFEFGWKARNGNNDKPVQTINPNSSDDGRCQEQGTSITLMEVLI